MVQLDIKKEYMVIFFNKFSNFSVLYEYIAKNNPQYKEILKAEYLLNYKYKVFDKIDKINDMDEQIKNELILIDKQKSTDVISTIPKVLLGIIIEYIDIESRLNLSECSKELYRKIKLSRLELIDILNRKHKGETFYRKKNRYSYTSCNYAQDCSTDYPTNSIAVGCLTNSSNTVIGTGFSSGYTTNSIAVEIGN
jgi:hypothetical protein